MTIDSLNCDLEMPSAKQCGFLICLFPPSVIRIVCFSIVSLGLLINIFLTDVGKAWLFFISKGTHILIHIFTN